MITIRKSQERGYANHGWLKSHHSFSFANYYDPQHMGFRSLRVINEDRIAGGGGFPMHPHRDMEILTYVASGALEHRDSAGNRGVIRPGEVQRMSAGTGVAHSEFNANADRELHLFQIWILPNKQGVPFSYGEKSFEKELGTKKLVLTASETGRDGSISIHQDVDVYVSRLKAGDGLSFELRPGRGAWLQMARGRAVVNGIEVSAGDGLVAEKESSLDIRATEESEFLLFDLA